jgi:hypothetical protein
MVMVLSRWKDPDSNVGTKGNVHTSHWQSHRLPCRLKNEGMYKIVVDKQLKHEKENCT